MRARFSVFILLLSCALFLARPVYADAVVGQAAPALVTPMLDGKNFDLASLKDKVVIVHFWATWCPSCRDEMPALEAVWRKYHGKGLEILAISADRPRAKAEVQNVMHYFTFPAAMMDSASKNEFGTPTALPITYVIGKDGILAASLTPDAQLLTEGSLGDLVKNLLDTKTETPKTEAPKTDVKP